MKDVISPIINYWVSFIIPSPIRGWDLVVVWFGCTLFFFRVVVNNCWHYGLVFKISRWNLLGTLVMGLIAYPDLWPDMSCCHGIMTENVLKNGQMNVRIVKSQEEMAKIHSYHDTWLLELNIFWYKFFRWPLTWPRYRSEVKKSLNPYSFLVFKGNLMIFSRESLHVKT